MRTARRPVAITGLGCCCALGCDPAQVAAAIDAGHSAVGPIGDHRDALGLGFAAVDVDVRPLLKRRKDRKLLPRSAHLALPAAVDALGSHRPPDIGLVMGVGREPPEDETEASILVSERDGQLDPVLLSGRGLALYPPLASLRTLPNMVLAHMAIQLDLTGPSATLAGDCSAGLAAVVQAVHEVAEGRADVALAGGADSLIHPVQARDAVRRGWHGALGEAAAVVRLEALSVARQRGAPILGVVYEVAMGMEPPGVADLPHHGALGRCGAADGVLALVFGVSTSSAGRVRVTDETGAFAALCWGPVEEAAP